MTQGLKVLEDELAILFIGKVHRTGLLMLYRVGGEVDGADVVTSASALEQETVGCRLEDQETRLPPRKTA